MIIFRMLWWWITGRCADCGGHIVILEENEYGCIKGCEGCRRTWFSL